MLFWWPEERDKFTRKMPSRVVLPSKRTVTIFGKLIEPSAFGLIRWALLGNSILCESHHYDLGIDQSTFAQAQNIVANRSRD